MDWGELKLFFKQYMYIREERRGLCGLLLYPYFRQEYKVTPVEAEYLATVDATGIDVGSTLAWARELRRYRKEREKEKKEQSILTTQPDLIYP